jgi:hypothetical protein
MLGSGQTTGERQIDIGSLPWSTREVAYFDIAVAFDLSEDAVDELSQDDESGPSGIRYWAGFVETASYFVSGGLNGRPIRSLGIPELGDLHARALAEDDPALFMQRFGDFVREEKQTARQTGHTLGSMEPKTLYDRVMYQFEAQK